MPCLDPPVPSINPCLAGTVGYILDLTTALINSPVTFTWLDQQKIAAKQIRTIYYMPHTWFDPATTKQTKLCFS